MSRHYEALLASRQALAQQSGMIPNPETTASLQRLLQSLHSLLESMDGYDPEAADDSVANEERSSEEREDWAFQRETFISQLEAENAQLRKALNIDLDSVRAEGFDEDDFKEVPLIPIISRTDPTVGTFNLDDHWASHAGASPPPNALPPAFQSQDNTPPPSISLQRPIELQQLTMRNPGPVRRPSMFGTGRRGGMQWSGNPPLVPPGRWDLQNTNMD